LIRQYFLQNRYCYYTGLILAALLVAASGCASKQPVSGEELSLILRSPGNDASSAEKGWWQAAFRISSDKETKEAETEPLWHVDLFLAHSVIAPVLEKFSSDIRLWRFHRRAVSDATGHQFRFIFYSSAPAAGDILREIATSSLLAKARSAGFFIDETYDDPIKSAKPAISDTSDDNWSIITQKAWPYYIMGASQTWLTMIDDIIKDNPPSPEATESIENLIAYYGEVNKVVNTLWRDEAQHAFLHHLNAIFGYEPLLYVEPRMLRF
jgi:hypothetical protein